VGHACVATGRRGFNKQSIPTTEKGATWSCNQLTLSYSKNLYEKGLILDQRSE